MGVPIRMQCRFSKDPADPNEPVCKRRKDAIIGKCDSCQEIFCSEHRFIETHNCKEQEYTKQKLFAENAEQLLKERTQVVRI